MDSPAHGQPCPSRRRCCGSPAARPACGAAAAGFAASGLRCCCRSVADLPQILCCPARLLLDLPGLRISSSCPGSFRPGCCWPGAQSVLFISGPARIQPGPVKISQRRGCFRSGAGAGLRCCRRPAAGPITTASCRPATGAGAGPHCRRAYMQNNRRKVKNTSAVICIARELFRFPIHPLPDGLQDIPLQALASSGGGGADICALVLVWLNLYLIKFFLMSFVCYCLFRA